MRAGSSSIRDLATVEECRMVVRLQEAVWGADGETVPASVLVVSAKRGGILLGAFESRETDAPLDGFVWSLPGIRRDGRRTHWSHMLGVAPAARGRGTGEQLKWAQRDRALAQDVDLVEWTFDPLQAANAHFNLHVLGAVVARYGIDVYGPLQGELHRGTPTDRLYAEWWIREPHVERRRAARGRDATLTARSAEVIDAPEIVRVAQRGDWLAPDGVEPIPAARRIVASIPPRYTDMQREATALALEWRLAMRRALGEALDAGYRAVDFFLDRERGGGRYLLARPDA